MDLIIITKHLYENKILYLIILYISNEYYSPRSKKILNLVAQIGFKRDVKRTLGGCIIYREKNYIILKKEKEN